MLPDYCRYVPLVVVTYDATGELYFGVCRVWCLFIFANAASFERLAELPSQRFVLT